MKSIDHVLIAPSVRLIIRERKKEFLYLVMEGCEDGEWKEIDPIFVHWECLGDLAAFCVRELDAHAVEKSGRK